MIKELRPTAINIIFATLLVLLSKIPAMLVEKVTIKKIITKAIARGVISFAVVKKIMKKRQNAIEDAMIPIIISAYFTHSSRVISDIPITMFDTPMLKSPKANTANTTVIAFNATINGNMGKIRIIIPKKKFRILNCRS